MARNFAEENAGEGNAPVCMSWSRSPHRVCFNVYALCLVVVLKE